MKRIFFTFIVLTMLTQPCKAMQIDNESSLETLRTLLKKTFHDPSVALNIRRQDDGRTPLHNAAEGGNLAYVQVMLEFGANPDIIDDNGNKPHELAQKNPLVAELLLKHMTKNAQQ